MGWSKHAGEYLLCAHREHHGREREYHYELLRRQHEEAELGAITLRSEEQLRASEQALAKAYAILQELCSREETN